MSEEHGTRGPFIVWENYGYEGWHPKSYNTLAEALQAQRYNQEWVITKPVQYAVNEIADT